MRNVARVAHYFIFFIYLSRTRDRGGGDREGGRGGGKKIEIDLLFVDFGLLLLLDLFVEEVNLNFILLDIHLLLEQTI